MTKIRQGRGLVPQLQDAIKKIAEQNSDLDLNVGSGAGDDHGRAETEFVGGTELPQLFAARPDDSDIAEE